MPEDVHRQKVKERGADMTVEEQLKGGAEPPSLGGTQLCCMLPIIVMGLFWAIVRCVCSDESERLHRTKCAEILNKLTFQLKYDFPAFIS